MHGKRRGAPPYASDHLDPFLSLIGGIVHGNDDILQWEERGYCSMLNGAEVGSAGDVERERSCRCYPQGYIAPLMNGGEDERTPKKMM